MIINSLAHMEKIVSRNKELEWVGWDDLIDWLGFDLDLAWIRLGWIGSIGLIGQTGLDSLGSLDLLGLD